MTAKYLARTLAMLCGALPVLVPGCGGRRFESESNPLSTTNAPQSSASNASLSSEADAGPTSPDTETATSALHSSLIDSDGGVPEGDSSIPEKTSAERQPESSRISSPNDAGNLDAASTQTTTDPTTSNAEHTSVNSDDPTNTQVTGSGEASDTGDTTDTPSSDDSETTKTSDAPKPVPTCGQDERARDKHCYFFGDDETAWEDARKWCHARGSEWDLAAITSSGEHEWVSKHLAGDAWIGGSKSGDKWRWVATDSVFWQGGETGKPVGDAFTWWEDTEPDAEGDAAQCLRYSDDSGEWAWADMPCRREYRYVCKR